MNSACLETNFIKICPEIALKYFFLKKNVVLYVIYSKKIEGDEYLCPWTVISYSVWNHTDIFGIKPICRRFSINLRYHVDSACDIIIYLCCLANYRLQISNNV